MRENRLSGSEGGGTEANQFLLPLSGVVPINSSFAEPARALQRYPAACSSKSCA